MDGEWWQAARDPSSWWSFILKTETRWAPRLEGNSSSYSKGLGTALLAQGEQLSPKRNYLAQTFVFAWAWFPGRNVIS